MPDSHTPTLPHHPHPPAQPCRPCRPSPPCQTRERANRDRSIMTDKKKTAPSEGPLAAEITIGAHSATTHFIIPRPALAGKACSRPLSPRHRAPFTSLAISSEDSP